MLGDFERHQVDLFQIWSKTDQNCWILELCDRAFDVKVTDVINDACAKGRTRSVCNTGTDQVQQSDFIQYVDYNNKEFLHWERNSGLQNFH
jgi:hypothetical protein